MVVGNTQTSDQLIRSHLRTRVGTVFSSATIRKDVRELYSLGYFSNITVDVARQPQGLAVTYRVVEKPVIDTITILGNKEISDKDLREKLTVRETDTYSARDLKSGLEKIKAEYANKVYPAATVHAAIYPVDKGKVHLVITVDEGQKSRIRGIEFVGNKAFSDKKLFKIVKTHKAFWFMGGKFEKDKLNADLDRIIARYGDEGYVDAKILGTDLDYRKNGKSLYITIYIEEGQQYHVADVKFDGNRAFLDRELRAVVTTQPGDVFNRGQVISDRARGIPGDPGAIQSFYVDNGYLYAGVEPQVRFDRETLQAHVTYAIREDRLVYVSAIDISGNVRTKDEVVRRRLTIRPGDRFDGEKIRRSARNVKNLGFFDENSPEIGHKPVSNQWADLLFHVTEGDMGRFNLGGGFSSDEGAIGFLELALTNFDITHWPTFSGGGQKFDLRLQQGTIRREFSVGLTDPYFMGYPFSLGVNFYTRRFDYQTGSDFSEKRTGARTTLSKWIAEDVSASLSLRAETTEIYDVASDASNELKLEEDEGSRNLISLGSTVTRDTRDYFYDPTSGSRLRVGTELAGGPMGGDVNFIKLTQDGIWYWPFFEKLFVLSFHERFGLMQEYASTERIPLFERFFAGGSTTIRGYEYRDVGPKSNDANRDPIGGKLQAIGNIELGWRPNNILGLYTFFDTGSVWQTDSDFDPNDLRHGVGVGIGIRTPMGPLRLDYGIPLNPDQDQGNGQFHFTTGLRF
ncbi:MAG: outer membrane protein assembly factor BamA [Candidatus Hydrogenedentes bacterium]|nr:outer membrane protein assembly factor BamA [Candidatus Hydrogenedentota bacterium]